MSSEMTFQIYNSVLKNMKSLKEEVRAKVANEVLKESKESLAKDYLPAISETIASRLMNYVSKTSPVVTEAGASKYFHLVENLKHLILPFIEKDKPGMMQEQREIYEGQIELLETKLYKASDSLKEAIAEIKTAYKKLDLTNQAHEQALARVKAFELLETSPNRNEIRSALLKCTTRKEVLETYQSLASHKKIEEKAGSLNGMAEVIRQGKSGGTGVTGVPKVMNEKTYEQRRLSGVI